MATKQGRRPIKSGRIGNVRVTVQRRDKDPYTHCVTIHTGGKRSETYFTSKEAAIAFAERKMIEAGNVGAAAAASVTDADRVFIAEAKRRLEPFGKTMADALDHYLGHLGRVQKSITVAHLVDRLETAKLREGKSRRYTDNLRVRLGRFAKSFGERLAADVQREEIATWLQGLQLAPYTVNHYRTLLSVLFNFGREHGYCAGNAAEKSFTARDVETEIGILSPSEAARLLSNAHDEIVPALALSLFAGVRAEELQRMSWGEIDLAAGIITLKAAKTKSARRRIVRIRDNLREWLMPYARSTGAIMPVSRQRGRKLMEKARRAAGFGNPGDETTAEKAAGITLKPWPSNAGRHSFASYDLALRQDAAALALEMGHTGTELIFAHYREVCRPTAAGKYFDIRPATDAGKVVAMPTSTAAAS